jgi:thioesterase domain-containing protein
MNMRRETPDGLVRLRHGGARSPLFLVYDIHGHVDGYNTLVQHLPLDQPIYGIEPHGFHGAPPDHHIEEAAAYCIALMRAVQPNGPFAVAGHSFSGTVTFEIGRELEAAGAPIALVGIMDQFQFKSVTPSARGVPVLTGTDLLLRHWRELMRHGIAWYFRGRIANRRQKTVNRVYKALYEGFQRRGRLLPRMLRSVELANWYAMNHYVPCACQGPIVLYRAADRTAWDPGEFLLGWNGLSNGGIEVCDVPGDHMTMLESPGVEVMACDIVERITRADAAAAHRARSTLRPEYA